ncbi:UDP-D-xylose:L-fucose alpha-1,3-D-xylosyltransferase [Holothuria leucospilota]|uniref:UDP-D-xylose:L-fucose alpha-1,3-D-xylosyltransferase n=1 Tax=Holothuria leucospilota TaxID=206669 RepID=A0A9Q1C133_HOLLE|nr:UDP-D-xylose:L-fucose alpha-1,3-D-xylosyltransferase [Holothuria leucospilota]
MRCASATKRLLIYIPLIPAALLLFKFAIVEDLTYLQPRPTQRSYVPSFSHNTSSNQMDFYEALDKFANSTVILTSTNAAFLPFAQNWVEYARRIPNLPPIIIVAEDEIAYDVMGKYPELTTVMSKRYRSPTERLKYLSKEYIKLINKRPTYIKRMLEKNINVLFSDVDTIWLDDPFPYLGGNYDVILQEDQPKPELVYCAGFIYFRATEATKKFVEAWLKHLAKYRNQKPDQKILNLELEKAQNLKTKVLNVELFPNGKNFFDRSWRSRHRVRPVIIHNNWVETLREKYERFDSLNLWLIPRPTLTPLSLSVLLNKHLV